MRKKYFWSLLFVMFLFGMPSAIAQYCVPSFSTGCSLSDYVDDFIITDNSGNTVLSHLGTACSTNAYGDFTGNAGLQFQLEGNTTYNFKTTVGTSSDYVAIWIDLNNNQSFADPGEMVFQATNSASPSSPLQASFTVPKLAGVITTRMRVVVEWNTAPSDPCNPSSSYGEMQDYQVTLIGENPNCLSPKNTTLVSASPANGAKFSWDAVSTAANGYKWLVLNSGDDPATATPVQSGTVASGTTTTTVSSLSTNTYYDFYVRSECSSSDHSVWRSIPFFIAEEGAACSNPFVVNALPYTNSQNTGDFLNELSGTPGTDCGVTGAYLDGNDVVYKYTADNDYILTVKLKDLSAANSAVFVYDECSDIGTQCAAAGSVGSTTADHSFKMSVVNGEDYYFVVSSAAPTASFDYTLSIDGFTCANYPAPIGAATQNYMKDQSLGDLSVQGSNLAWYANAGLSTKIPDSTLLSNNTTYYVTQTFQGCESSALAVTVHKKGCNVLAIDSTTAFAVCGEGSALLTATGADAVANTKIYWYDQASGGDPVGRGESFYTPKINRSTFYWVSEVAVTGQGAMAPEMLYYTFDEGNSITNHASSPVGDNPASIKGNLTVGGNGLSGKALEGTGSSSSSNYVDTGWDTYFSGGSFTIGFWIKANTNASGNHYIFGDTGADSFRCYYSASSGRTYYKPNNGLGSNISFLGLIDGNAHYVHFVYDASAGKVIIYIDGQVVKTESAPTSYTWQKGSGLKIGGYSSSSGLDGKMDEFRIYNRALNQSEIQSTIAISLGGETLCESPRKKVQAVVNHVEDITVNEPLPYVDTDNTENYFNNYSGIPGRSCSNEPYLDGYEVIYRYSPTVGGVFSVNLSGLSSTDASIFIYKSCDDIGDDCYAGMVSDGTTNDFGLDEVIFNDGQDYYILISTKKSMNTDYTLTIDKAQINCADYTNAPEGDQQLYFQAGDSLSSLDIEGANLSYYNASSLDSIAKLADTIAPVDGNTYYVTQTLNGCESDPLKVTVTKVDCSTLMITQTQDVTVVCKGAPTLTVQAAKVSGNTEVYWYDSPIEGEVLQRGKSYKLEDPVSQTSSFWVAQVLLAGQSYVPGFGKVTPTGNSFFSSTSNYGLVFDVYENFTLHSVDVYPDESGNLEISLFDSSGNLLYSKAQSVSASPNTPVTIVLDFTIPAGTGYRLLQTSDPSLDLLRDSSGNNYPYGIGQNGGFGQINGGAYGSTGTYVSSSYYYFYNWTIGEENVICESPRKKVTVTVSADGDEIVNNLPYTDSTSTANYGNAYSGKPGSDCNTEENYFNGDETVYSFEATQDSLINVQISNLNDYYAGVFIYRSCSDIGTHCEAGAAAGPSNNNLLIKDFEVEAGEKYYIVVSSWLTQDVSYKIDIDYFSCADVPRPKGDTLQRYIAGDVVSDLEADSTHVGAELHWYSDANLSNEITDLDNTALVDGKTYYVTQTFQGCESVALSVEASKIDCSTLAITKYSVDTIACRGTAMINVTASGTGDKIYWYTDSISATPIAVGNALETAEITQDTTFWVSEVRLDGNGPEGPYGFAAPQYGNGTTTDEAGISFVADKPFTLISVDVYVESGSGDIEINLEDNMGNVLQTKIVNIPSGSSGQMTIPLHFHIPSSGTYSLTKSSASSVSLMYEYDYPQIAEYPFNLGNYGRLVEGTRSNNAYDYYYYYFYNWIISGGEKVCESPRKKVTVVVDQSGNFNLDYQDLPYTDTNNTALFGNRYSGNAGTGCKGANYLNGSETLYHYKADPQNDDILTIELSNVTNNDAAVFVYSSCGEIGRNCLAGATYENGNVIIRDYYISAGEEIMIVVSSATGSTKYDLSINGLVCNNVRSPRGDTAPYFGTGYTVADLVVKGSAYNTGFKWYSDSTLTTQITNLSSVNLVDGDTYYVTQTIKGCESNALAISPIAFNCGALSVTVPQQTYYVCAPGGDIQVSVDTSGIGNQIYWYADSTSTSIIAIGSPTVLHAPQDTTYYVSEMRLSGAMPKSNIGKQNTSDTYGSTSDGYGLGFEVTKPMMIETVDLFSMGSAGTLTVNLLDSNENIIRQRTVNVPAGSNSSPKRVTVNLNMQVPSPGTYYLVAGSDQVDLSGDYSGGNYPYAIGSFGNITGGKTSYSDNSSTYYYFYNWTVSTADIMCESPRTPVVIKVNDSVTPAPVVTPKHTICGKSLLSDIEVLGTDIQWYMTNGIAVPSNSPIVEGESYYVSQTLKGCESVLTEVIMDFLDKSAKPVAATNQPFLEGELLSDLDVQGKNLRWYEDQFMLHPLDSATTALVDQETYYVTQTRQGECESEPLAITVSRTLNVNSPEFAGIKMYPNPVETLLTIDNQYPIDQITVYDMTGRQVYVEHYSKSTIQIDFSNFASGAYFIKARIDGKAQVFRVIKK